MGNRDGVECSHRLVARVSGYIVGRWLVVVRSLRYSWRVPVSPAHDAMDACLTDAPGNSASESKARAHLIAVGR